MRTIRSVIVFLCMMVIVYAGSPLTVGTPESILKSVIDENTRMSSLYTLTASSGEKIPVHADFFYFENGELSMNGKAVESEKSEFILKGDRESVYGWVIFHEKNTAYEYTTDASGVVVCERVPISKLIIYDEFDTPKKPGNGTLEPRNSTDGMTAIPHTPSQIDTEYWMKTYPKSIPWIGKYPGTSVLKLQSRPGAKRVIWMDCRQIMNGEEPKKRTKEELWIAWQITAASYSMYKCNTTTDQSVADAAGTQNTGNCRMYDGIGFSHAHMGTFGTSGDHCDIMLQQPPHPPGGYSVGRVTAHEFGHVTGQPDFGGNPGGNYFVGFKEFKWNCLMGQMWPGDTTGLQGLIQWTKGEYATATQHQDVCAVMEKVLGGYVDDDITTPVPLKYTGSTNKIDAENNFGMIAPNTDTDSFTFEIKGEKGHVKFRVDRLEHRGGSKLDIDASILDASGKVVAQDNQVAIRYSKFDMDLPVGKYTVVVKGGAEGTPQKGFSNYSSMGLYGFEGEIIGGTTPITMQDYVNNESIRIHTLSPGGMLTFDIPGSFAVEKVALYSMKGAKVFQSRGRVGTVDMSRMASGMYALHITADGTNLVRRIIKQ